jgi:hypothetical protein
MKIAKKALKLADAFKVRHADSFRLKDFDSADTHGIHSKDKADQLLQQSVAVLRDLQEKLYAPGPVGRAADLSGHGRRWQR